MPEPRRTRPGPFCGYALRVGDADYLFTPSVADFPVSRDREDGFLEPGRPGPMELVFAPGGEVFARVVDRLPITRRLSLRTLLPVLHF